MAETKDKSSTPVKAPEAPLLTLGEVNNDPNVQQEAEVNKPVGAGENLYFFPDIQKSVVANSFEDAVAQVQSDLDAFKKSQEDNQ